MKVLKALGIALVLLLVGGMVFAQAKVTLNILAYGDNSTPEGQLATAQIDDFAGANPDLVVKYEMLYDEAYHQKARARIAAKDVPDVMYLWSGARSSYIYDAKLGVDLRKLIDTSKYTPATMAAQGPKGEIWEVPFTFGISSVMFENTALLKSLGLTEPKTYEDLVAMVAPLKAKGVDVIAWDAADAWVANSCILGTLVARVSGNLHWISEAAAGKHKFTDKPFVDSLALLQKFYADGVFPSTAVQTDYGTTLSNFVNGQALFLLDGHWRSGGFEDKAFQAKVKMMVFPKLPGEQSATAGSSSGEATPGYGLTTRALRTPGVQSAAIRFLNYVNGLSPSLLRLQILGFLPARKMPLPTDIAPIVAEKARFYNQVSLLADVPDSWVKGKMNDDLNTGMQKIALGQATPQQVAEQMEADRR